MKKKYLDVMDLPRDPLGCTGNLRKLLCEAVNRTRGHDTHRKVVADILKAALQFVGGVQEVTADLQEELDARIAEVEKREKAVEVEEARLEKARKAREEKRAQKLKEAADKAAQKPSEKPSGEPSNKPE